LQKDDKFKVLKIAAWYCHWFSIYTLKCWKISAKFQMDLSSFGIDIFKCFGGKLLSALLGLAPGFTLPPHTTAGIHPNKSLHTIFTQSSW